MPRRLQEPVPRAQRYLRPGVAIPNETYRLSRYALAFPRPTEHDGASPDAVRLHNLVTGELAGLSASDAAQLERLPLPYKPWMDEFIAGYFLVPANFDEKEWVDFLRCVAQAKQSRQNCIPSFVVMPTTACNAHCPYCFEQGMERVSMSAEVEARTAEYIARLSHAGSAAGAAADAGVASNAAAASSQARAHIVWYGGEPLLGAASITRICEMLRDAQVQWKSHILTNAYLVDEALAAHMRSAWLVERALITIDGTEAEYNRIKAYADAQDSPFKRVMRNIGLLMDAGIAIHIRLHLTQDNYADLCALVPLLADAFAGRPRLSVHVSILGTSCENATDHYSADILRTLHGMRNALIGRLKDAGLESSSALVGLRISSCIASAPRSAIIDPTGRLSRCYQHAADGLGSIFDMPAAFPEPLCGVLETPKCARCALYPDCLRNTRCRTKCSPADREGRIAQVGADAWRLQ